MGTELLKDKYNFLINDQKKKLEKLKKKKEMVQTTKLLSIDDEKDFDEEQQNLELDNDFFSKFNQLQYESSSDEEKKGKNSKILIKNQKKTETKKNDSKQNIQENDVIKDSTFFSDTIREMKDENGRLRKLLAEKDYEINYLKKKIDEEKSIIGIAPISGDAAATKIVDLAKKLRELTSTFEAEKTKNKQLLKNCKELEKLLEKYKEKEIKNDQNSEIEEDDQDSDLEKGSTEKKISPSKQIKELKEKLSQITHKMMEYRSQTEILKQDLKKTQKALEKEVGENFDIKSIISGQGNWKGRQQQIIILQNKLNELKLQVGIMDARASQSILCEEDFDDSNFVKDMPKSSHLSINSGYSLNSFNSGTVRTAINIDSKQRYELKKIDKEKKEQIEKLRKEYETLENEISSVKEKLEASKSRNKVLANENKTLKDQVKTLLDKGKHDDELIEALMKKQNQLKDLLDTINQQHEKVSRELEMQSKDSQIKSMQEKNTVDQLKSIISEREERVKQLERELDIKRNNEFFIHGPKSDNTVPFENLNNTSNSIIDGTNDSDPAHNIVSNIGFMRARSDSNSLTTCETERNNISINSSRSNFKSNKRPHSVTNLNAQLIEQKKVNVTSLKLENNELKTLNKTSEIERMRLMELVKSLQKRIEELNEKAMDNENKLNELRRKSVNLEKQIEKSKLQESKNTSANKAKTVINNTSSMDQYKIEELETSLLIQKDENDALKAALKSTLEAKEEDLRLYVEMLEGSKRIFLDGLKQYKQIASTEN